MSQWIWAFTGWAIWGQACWSAHWQASMFVLWNNKCQWMRNLDYVRSFPTPDSIKSRPMGKMVFTFKIQYKLLSKTQQQQIPKALCWGKDVPPRTAVILEQVQVYRGWGEGAQKLSWGIFPALTSIYQQQLSYTHCGNQNCLQILLNALWSIKLSMAENHWLY